MGRIFPEHKSQILAYISTAKSMCLLVLLIFYTRVLTFWAEADVSGTKQLHCGCHGNGEPSERKRVDEE